MVKTKQQLVSSRALTYPGVNGRKYITIHETANKDVGADAQTHANLQTNGFTSSWQWQVDDKEAIQSFPHTVRCWHAGDSKGNGNFNSIGIEICVNADGDFKQAVKNAAELVKMIMHDEGIPLSKVVQHNKWSGKNCPTNLRNGSKGINWSHFINMVSGSGGDTTYTPPKTETKPATVNKPSKPKINWTKVNGNWTGQILKRGQYGDPVTQLQTKLAKNDPPFYPNKVAKNNGIDSYYGSDTEDAVSRFQTYYGLAVDGLAGKATYNKLGGKTTANLKVDGYMGKATIKAMQQYFGTTVDGVISRPSLVIKKLQGTLKVKADGYMGPNTIKAMQRRFKTPVDGKFSKPSLVIKELQKRLNKGKL